MSSRKTLKSVSVEGLKPTITLTPVVEPCGEGCRIHHIESDSIARDGRDTFVPLRHVSKQKRRIFELEEENAKMWSELESVGTAAYLYGRDQLKTENAKLRELVRRYVEYTSQDRCEGCVVKSRCNDGEVDECWQLTEIRGLAREIGVEVE